MQFFACEMSRTNDMRRVGCKAYDVKRGLLGQHAPCWFCASNVRHPDRLSSMFGCQDKCVNSTYARI
jgi:hypothetical protein